MFRAINVPLACGGQGAGQAVIVVVVPGPPDLDVGVDRVRDGGVGATCLVLHATGRTTGQVHKFPLIYGERDADFLGAVADYDNRDNDWGPTSGVLAHTDLMFSRDAFGANRQRLTTLATATSGTRLLPDDLFNVPQNIVVPKDRPAALAAVNALIDEARASGLLQRAIERGGAVGVAVAPAGVKAGCPG